MADVKSIMICWAVPTSIIIFKEFFFVDKV